MLSHEDIRQFKIVMNKLGAIVNEAARVSKTNFDADEYNKSLADIRDGVAAILTASIDYYKAVEYGDGEPGQEWDALKAAIEKFEG